MQFHQFKQIKYLQVKTRFHSSSNKLVFKKGRKRKRDREKYFVSVMLNVIKNSV